MSDIEWRTVQRWPSYEVSNTGLVRNARTKYVLKPSLNNMGYQRVEIWGLKRFVHHLVAEEFLGPRPLGANILHGPQGKTVNAVTNLRYGTQSENVRDSVLAGTHYFTRTPYKERKNRWTDVDNAVTVRPL